MKTGESGSTILVPKAESGPKKLKKPIHSDRRSRFQGVFQGGWFYRQEDFLRKTQWLILWRLVFISFFLLLTVILQEKGNISFSPFLHPGSIF